MAQKIFNLDKWTLVEEGAAIHFTKRNPRNVAIDVNSPGDVHYYVLIDQDVIEMLPKHVEEVKAQRASVDERAGTQQYFLGVAKGRDRFEFAVQGEFRLYVENGPTYITSSDGEFTHTVVPEEEKKIFTKVANRRARNPQLEMMEYTMKLNQQRFMEAMTAEMDRREKAIGERYADERPKRAPSAKVAARRPEVGTEDGAEGPVDGAGEDEALAGETGASGKGAKKRKSSTDAE